MNDNENFDNSVDDTDLELSPLVGEETIDWNKRRVTSSFHKAGKRRKGPLQLTMILVVVLVFMTLHHHSSASLQEEESAYPPLKAFTSTHGVDGDSRSQPGQLRIDWSSVQPHSQLAKLLTAQRTDCSQPLKWYEPNLLGGLGNELRSYTLALCLAHQYQVRLYTPHFTFMDPSLVHEGDPSLLNPFFTTLELQCPGDVAVAQQQQQLPYKQLKKQRFDIWKKQIWMRNKDYPCASLLNQLPDYSNLDARATSLEAVFTAGLSQAVVEEAQRQHKRVFSNGVPPAEQLITVHVRWGDKATEMELVPMQEYIQAVYEIAEQQGLQPSDTHVFLATEDPKAVEAFNAGADERWTVYTDQFYYDFLPLRSNETQDVAAITHDNHGDVGLLAMGSLLVALEANHYVLTSASNWSRMMNLLRRTVVRAAACEGGFIEPGQPGFVERDCTSAVDLRKSDFWMEWDKEGNGV